MAKPLTKPLTRPAATLLPRERIWAAIRELRVFTIVDLVRLLSRTGRLAKPALRAIDDMSVLSYCQRLRRAGILTAGPAPGLLVLQFRLARDVGIEAPHLNAAGHEITTGRWMEQAWRSLRIVRGDWTVAQLADLASTAEHPARPAWVAAYVAALVRAGYVMVVQESTRKAPARLRLRAGAWSGPRPPQVVKLRAVFDRNTGATVTLDDPAEVADEA